LGRRPMPVGTVRGNQNHAPMPQPFRNLNVALNIRHLSVQRMAAPGNPAPGLVRRPPLLGRIPSVRLC
jgi:hypothetical protein